MHRLLKPIWHSVCPLSTHLQHKHLNCGLLHFIHLLSANQFASKLDCNLILDLLSIGKTIHQLLCRTGLFCRHPSLSAPESKQFQICSHFRLQWLPKSLLRSFAHPVSWWNPPVTMVLLSSPHQRHWKNKVTSFVPAWNILAYFKAWLSLIIWRNITSFFIGGFKSIAMRGQCKYHFEVFIKRFFIVGCTCVTPVAVIELFRFGFSSDDHLLVGSVVFFFCCGCYQKGYLS